MSFYIYETEYNSIEECSLCDGTGEMMDEKYIASGCPKCETRGFVYVNAEGEDE